MLPLSMVFQSQGPYADSFEFEPNFPVNELLRQPFGKRYRQHIPLQDIETERFLTVEERGKLRQLFWKAYCCNYFLNHQAVCPLLIKPSKSEVLTGLNFPLFGS